MTKAIRAYDAKVLADIYNTLTQIVNRVNGVLSKSDSSKTVADLPDSILPTDTLYAVALCYCAMYDLLLEYDLIKNGHHKIDTNTIH